MQKIFILILLAVVTGLFTGCSTTGPGRKKLELTQKQKSDLIDYVRFFIVRNKRIASPKEKEYIKRIDPKFRYNVDSNGRDIVSVSWNLNRKDIKAVGQGILFTHDMNWKVGVTKRDKIVRLKNEDEVKQINNQNQKEIFKDFLPLLTK